MAKARKILRRLRSIRNIHEVTRAMYMVSTARFKHAHDRLVAARPYLSGLMDLAAEAAAHRPPGGPTHPLLRPAGALPREADRFAAEAGAAPPGVLLVIASRRGLCGSYNNAVAEAAAAHVRRLQADGGKVRLRSSGRRGQLILGALGCPVERTYPQFDRIPDPAAVGAIADELTEEFSRGSVSWVEVACTLFASTSHQKPAIVRLLPLEVPAPRGAPGARGEPPPPAFLPDAETVYQRIMPQALRARLLECFLEASVSEHVARMTAMRYASENAQDLIHELTVRYNRARQGQITMELAEIMGGREGVEGL
jgi:F-type H+-transporting ATPase subunit gamma